MSTASQTVPLLLPWLATLGVCLGATTAGAARPNILLIVADDLGYGDLGCYGSKQIETPNLDKIAAQGVRFTDAYVTASVCAPSRAGLLTGRYQQRFGFEHNPIYEIETAELPHGIPVSERLMGDHLKKAGYRTGYVGKWHVGQKLPEQLPNARGFDFFFGFHGGMHAYFPGDEKNALWRNDQKVTAIRTPYLTDWMTDEAMDFVSEKSEQPWFLVVSYNCPHTPLEAKEEDLTRFSHIPSKGRRTYAAMIHNMDANIGRLQETIKTMGDHENTLVVFLSDNGGAVRVSYSCNAPLRGMKGNFLEGGVRVPFLASWPAVLPKGEVYEAPVSSLDLLPTFLSAAGVDPEASQPTASLDGENLLPALTSDKAPGTERALYWKMALRGSAVRAGDWKLLVTGHSPPQLYHLDKDVSELTNTYDDQRAVAERLWAKLNHWQESLESGPLWIPSATKGSTSLQYDREMYFKVYWLTQPERDQAYEGFRE